MNNIDDLIEDLTLIAQSVMQEISLKGPEEIEAIVAKGIDALREQQANAIMLEAARDHELEANRKLQERIAKLDESRHGYFHGVTEQSERAQLAERQRDAALERIARLERYTCGFTDCRYQKIGKRLERQLDAALEALGAIRDHVIENDVELADNIDLDIERIRGMK